MKRLASIFDNIREQSGAWLSRAIAVFVLLCLFFVAGGGVSHNAKLRIDRVDILGAHTVSEDSVRALVQQKLKGNYFFVYARENIYLFPRSEIKQILLSTFPRVAEVSVQRIDDHVIAVTLIERTPYALWCGEEPNETASQVKNCWFIDRTGFVFDQAPIFSRGVYIEVYGKLLRKNEGETLRAVLPRDHFKTADSFAVFVRDNIGKPFQIVMSTDNETEVALQSSTPYPFLSGAVIRFKNDADPAVLLKNLFAAIPVQFPENTHPKKKLQYIDMRFGNKVIFGFEN